MQKTKKKIVYKNNVLFWIYHFCMGFITANMLISVIMGFSAGILLSSFAGLFLFLFIFAEMQNDYYNKNIELIE